MKRSGGRRGQGSQLSQVWYGTKVVDAMVLSTREAMDVAAAEAKEYWDETVWGEVPNERHPDATGNMRDHGHFDVQGDPGTFSSRMIGWVDLDEEYPFAEEFGNGHREGHHPLRTTMDWAGPRIRLHLARAARRNLAAIRSGR